MIRVRIRGLVFLLFIANFLLSINASNAQRIREALNPQNAKSLMVDSTWKDYDLSVTDHYALYSAYCALHPNIPAVMLVDSTYCEYQVDSLQSYFILCKKTWFECGKLVRMTNRNMFFEDNSGLHSVSFDSSVVPAYRSVIREPLTPQSASHLSIDLSWVNYNMRTTDHRALYLAYCELHPNIPPALILDSTYCEYQVDSRQNYWILFKNLWLPLGKLVSISEMSFLFEALLESHRLFIKQFDRSASGVVCKPLIREPLTPESVSHLSVDSTWSNYNLRTTDHRALYLAYCELHPNIPPVLTFRSTYCEYQVDSKQNYWIRFENMWFPLGKLVSISEHYLFERLGGQIFTMPFDRSAFSAYKPIIREPLAPQFASHLSIDSTWANYNLRATDHRALYLAYLKVNSNDPVLKIGSRYHEYKVDDQQCYWALSDGKWAKLGKLIGVTEEVMLFETPEDGIIYSLTISETPAQ